MKNEIAELLPKTAVFTDFTQSAQDALEVPNRYVTTGVELTSEGIGGTDIVVVTLQTANRRDEDAFSPTTGTFTLDASNPTGYITVNDVGRLVRVALTPSLTSGFGANVRATARFMER